MKKLTIGLVVGIMSLGVCAQDDQFAQVVNNWAVKEVASKCQKTHGIGTQKYVECFVQGVKEIQIGKEVSGKDASFALK